MARRRNLREQREQDLVEGEQRVRPQNNERMENVAMISLLPEIQGNGTEDLQHIFRQAESIARLAHWNDMQLATVLKTRFKGQAYEYLTKNRTLREAEDPREIERLVTERFQVTKSLLQRQQSFQNIHQSPSTTIADLAVQVQNSTTEFLGENENEEIMNKIMLAKFLQALRADVKRELIRLNVQDFRVAVQRAKEIDSLLAEEYGESEYTVNKLSIEENKSKEQELRDRITELENKLKEKETTDINFCLACEKQGHKISECFTFRRFLKNREYRPRRMTYHVNYDRGGYGTRNRFWNNSREQYRPQNVRPNYTTGNYNRPNFKLTREIPPQRINTINVRKERFPHSMYRADFRSHDGQYSDRNCRIIKDVAINKMHGLNQHRECKIQNKQPKYDGLRKNSRDNKRKLINKPPAKPSNIRVMACSIQTTNMVPRIRSRFKKHQTVTLCDEVRKNQLSRKLHYKRQYQRFRRKEPDIGDWAYVEQLRPTGALDKKFSGPFEIIKLFRNRNVLLKHVYEPQKVIKIHANKLRILPQNRRE